MSEQWLTRKTLLCKITDPQDNAAWNEFIEYYGRFIYHIILKMGVGSANADDIAQQIALTLWQKINTYDSTKGHFRPWLSTVIRNSVNQHFRREKRRLEKASVSAEEEELSSTSEVDLMIQREWEAYLTDEALQRVKAIFSGKAVEAFLMGLDGHSNGEIAEQLKITLSSVKVLKARVKSCFVSEMKRLTKSIER